MLPTQFRVERSCSRSDFGSRAGAHDPMSDILGANVLIIAANSGLTTRSQFDSKCFQLDVESRPVAPDSTSS